jgi:hypothetical protein
MSAPRVPPPTTPRNVPGWSCVYDDWHGLKAGDAVLVDGRRSGRVVSIASNRVSGGVYVIVRLDDGTAIGRRPGDLLRVIEPKTGEEAR